MEPLPPTYTADLFPGLHALLMALLRGLGDDDWARPTLAAPWLVRDVAAHLLDGDLRKLSAGRDRHPIAREAVSSFADIVALINRLNAGGVGYAGRLSPRVITDLLDVSGRWVSEYVATLAPHDPAHFPVAWAGEDQSENWMDTGREYTERWHHQMQIRDAVGAAGLLEDRWLAPVLHLSVRVFRQAYRDVPAAVGTAVVFEVVAEGEYVWSVIRDTSGWRVVRGRAPDPAACVRADADTAWRVLYNALPAETAGRRVTVTGDRALAEPMLRARAVMVALPGVR